MRRFWPAFIISILLHVGLFLLAYISWMHAPKPLTVSSVPVELVAQVPSRQMAEAPVDKLAVKTPAPEPAPETPPVPTPPTPAPKLPIPAPVKPVAKPEPKPVPKPDKTPAPKPVDKTPPDKDGLKKPQPPKPAKPTLDLDALSQLAAAPSKSKTRTMAQANTHKTDGASNFGSGPQDAGTTKAALTALTARLQKLWSPNCDVPGGNQVQVDIQFTISPNGRVIRGPDWVDHRSDSVWEAGATRAMLAVKRGELYDDLPAGLYNNPITITFDAKSACRGQ